MTTLTAAQVSASIASASISTAELLAFYNVHAETPVKRFADRKTAERRVSALIVELAERAEAVEAAPVVAPNTAKADRAALIAARLSTGNCPACGGDASSQTGNGPDGTKKGDNENFCHECGSAYHRNTGAPRKPYGDAPSASRSEAIAKTWKDPVVAALRAARHKVAVNGVSYDSTPAAFRALRLPMGKMTKFRGALREAGTLDFVLGSEKYTFVIVSE